MTLTNDDRTKLISGYIRKAQKEEIFYDDIFSDPSLKIGKNQFLFFIKPEITVESDTIRLEDTLEHILDKINTFGFQIHAISILSARYLEKYDIIDQHYGVIGKISNRGTDELSESAKNRFTDVFGIPVKSVKVLGGIQFLNEYKFFNFHSLDCLWQNSENVKLGGGAYCEKLRMDKETVYLLNGFHPKQLKHFTEMGRSIVVFNISGDISWREARTNFAGATNPMNAAEGSIRRMLLEKKQELGIPEVSQSFNGIHLSAGPVEALIELRRFGSDVSAKNGEKRLTDFPFGRLLTERFKGDTDKILENPTVMVSGKPVSVFDLTEEKDSDEAMALLEKYVLP